MSTVTKPIMLDETGQDIAGYLGTIAQNVGFLKGDPGQDGLTTSVTVNGETITQVGGNINIGTVIRQHQDISGKLDKPTLKTSMDSVATANTQYYLGVQTAVNIVLPSNAETGQQISAVWYNGATAATLSITGTMLDCDYAPSANSRSEINALWDGTYWAVVTNEQAVTA